MVDALTSIDASLSRCVRQVVVEELSDLHHVQTVDRALFLASALNIRLFVDEDADFTSAGQLFSVIALAW